MLLLRASAVVLWTVQVQAIIPSRFEDIHRRSSHHTCDTNDECQARLKSLWSPYTFVCCTTVVCDENYGNYYLAYSGCTPQRQCAPIVQMKGYSRFAARFERRIFDSFDASVVGDCALTRQKTKGDIIPNVTFVSEKPQPTTSTQPTVRVMQSPQCPCKNPAECCLHIICADSLQKEAQDYLMQVECIPQCVHLSTRAGYRYVFYMTLKTWSRRAEYEHIEEAPSVEGSCRETRYFHDWATDDAN